MSIEGILIRKERLRRGWSQEGLCRGVCAVSYLSKIEKGKTAASDEILCRLFARLGIVWHSEPEELAQLHELIESMYDALFSDRVKELHGYADAFREKEETLRFSPCALDAMLLRSVLSNAFEAIPKELESCLDARQLALQRSLQKRFREAAAIWPKAYFYKLAAQSAYECGENYPSALELFQTGCDMAAREGSAHLMLACRLLMGNCYGNMLDVPNMLAQYETAARLARALEDGQSLEAIRYNTAAVQLQTGDFAAAYAYFSQCSEPSLMTLHKLAICCEKLGRTEEALAALDRAETMESEQLDTQTARRLCRLVRMRLENPDYLHDASYGELLLSCFAECREQLPIGYAAFHLPWVLEWYTAARQYKQAYQLMRSFPKALLI